MSASNNPHAMSWTLASLLSEKNLDFSFVFTSKIPALNNRLQICESLALLTFRRSNILASEGEIDL